MRIALLATAYPPVSTEGIARQRATLAAALARRGHEVHVVTVGRAARATREDQGATVHEAAPPPTMPYSPRFRGLDGHLSQSQALYETLAAINARAPLDVVDVPLWAAQGWVTLARTPGPTVVWLQTTTVQLARINGRPLTDAERVLVELERDCMRRADGILGDSRSALAETPRDYGVRSDAPSDVVYLGVPPMPAPERPPRREVELLVVGRLERRKGTPLLFEILPDILRARPHVAVRFAGRDNSRQDGWHAQRGGEYAEVFRRLHPDLAGRVAFEGYVGEGRLAELYRGSDALLGASVYESFGIHYLEAMRSAMPVVAFDTGGAGEIFAGGEASGALLAAPGDTAALRAAVARLCDDPALRGALGRAGLRRFAAFTDDEMARRTADFYEAVIREHARRRGPARVFQVMEALDSGDAVSEIALAGAELLGELGHPGPVLARQAAPALAARSAPLERALEPAAAHLIFHYWGYSTATWMLRALRGRRAAHYHNITPPQFFRPDSAAFRYVRQGYLQLAQIADLFDLLIGDSRYNLSELARFLRRPRPAITLYPPVEPGALLAAPHDEALLRRLRAAGGPNLLFVGRVAPNKRQDRLMRLLDVYRREVDPRARLWLVGSERFDPQYRADLERLRGSLPSADQIVFTGKVSDAELMSYFRAADAFVCASDHEGFCMPVAQAMAFGVPVLAYAAAAVPETMGGAGVLAEAWDERALAAELAALVAPGSARREGVVAGQLAALGRFSRAEARRALGLAVQLLTTGEADERLDVVEPAG